LLVIESGQLRPSNLYALKLNQWEGSPVSQKSFSIRPVPPFRLDLTVWALRRRPENTVDRWDGSTYRRVLMIDGKAVQLEVRQTSDTDNPQLEIDLTGSHLSAQQEKSARLSLERMLGVHEDLRPFYSLAARDRRLQPLVEEFRGVKPPRFPSIFEALANGVACQQLSLLVGILLLSRLAAEIGVIAAFSKNVQYAFPDPTDFTSATIDSLKSLGFSANKSRALLEASSAIRDRRLLLESLTKLDNHGAVEELLKLRGVGRWTAEYVLLRGLGRLDIFPGDDVGARKKLAQFLHKKNPLDYDGVRRAVADWQPYSGFVYFHLLLARIKKAGWLNTCLDPCVGSEMNANSIHKIPFGHAAA
jgi:DNA-3-methyladenine glycosylase II